MFGEKWCLLELNSLIFFEIPRGLSESKRTRNKPKLDNVCVVRFVRGSTHIFWKESMGAGKFNSSEFLLKKISDKIFSGLLFPTMYPNGLRSVPVSQRIWPTVSFGPRAIYASVFSPPPHRAGYASVYAPPLSVWPPLF